MVNTGAQHSKKTRSSGFGQEGTVALEFALVAPVLFLLLIGFLEMGLIFFTQTVLENATTHAGRLGKTGYSVGGNRETWIRNELWRSTGGYLDPSQINVTILTYTRGWNAIGQLEPCWTAACTNGASNLIANIDYEDINNNNVRDDQGIQGAGTGTQIVHYEVTYSWPIITPMLCSIIGNPACNFDIKSTTTVRNEGF